MAEGEKNKQSFESSDLRYKYIGFDVFPGKAGDIFKSDEERKSFVGKVTDKLARSAGEVRDRCTLIQNRISGVEKIFLTLAAVVLIGSLFVPWFSGSIPVAYQQVGANGEDMFYYVESDDARTLQELAATLKKKQDRTFRRTRRTAGEEQPPAAAPEEPAAVGEEAAVADSLAVSAEAGPAASDSAAMPEEVAGEQAGAEPEESEAARISPEIRILFIDTSDPKVLRGSAGLQEHVIGYYSFNSLTRQENLQLGRANALRAIPYLMAEARAADSIAAARTDSLRQVAERQASRRDSTAVDSISVVAASLVTEEPVPELAVRGIINDTYSLTGIGAILSIGTFGSMIFANGIILTITGIILVLYLLLCVMLAAVNLYVLHGHKKAGTDDHSLYLKKMLRFNWIPVGMWLVMFLISFIGSPYGFDSAGMLEQVGASYGIGTFIGLSSFGMYLTLAAFLVTALKGKEI